MKKAFTLVELIVVITILAILGTIAFISLQGYSKEARDAKRIQDVRSLLTKLNTENVKGTPYNDMLIGGQIHDIKINGNTEEVYQGNIDFEYLRENRDNFVDPETGKDYEFATTEGTTRYNNEDQRFNFIEGRYKSEKTNEEVVLGNYYKYLASDADNLFTGSINNPYEGPEGRFEVKNGLCSDCKNIIIRDGNGNGYTIMDRNLGASEAGLGKTAYGDYYQYGNNKPWSSDNTLAISWTTTTVDASSFGPGNYYTDTGTEMRYETTNYDWTVPQNDDLWGGVNGTNRDRRGPCNPGYHVPTVEEWLGLVSIWYSLKGETCTNNSCNWGTSASMANFQNEFKIPSAGQRRRISNYPELYGSQGRYWSSTPYLEEIANMWFTNTYIGPFGADNRAYGFSVRCFKD